jgi:hypothetical protein
MSFLLSRTAAVEVRLGWRRQSPGERLTRKVEARNISPRAPGVNFAARAAAAADGSAADVAVRARRDYARGTLSRSPE